MQCENAALVPTSKGCLACSDAALKCGGSCSELGCSSCAAGRVARFDYELGVIACTRGQPRRKSKGKQPRTAKRQGTQVAGA